MLRWGRRLQRFARLPSSERRLVMHALVVHAHVRLKLWRHGVEASRSVESRFGQHRSSTVPDVEPYRLARLVSHAIREGPLRGNCLSESMTVSLLLLRSGHPCTMRIGARRCGAGMEAHAWVELNGVPLNESADIGERFIPFPASAEPVLRWVV